MSFNQFTNLDFSSLRTQIKDYLRSSSKFSDFDFEGSNFSVLIDTLAYNSYITSYNTNMSVNEAFLDSATVRENITSLARNIGYVPRSSRSAVAQVNLSVNFGESTENTVISATIKAGIFAIGSINSGNYVFSIPEDVTVPVNTIVSNTSDTKVANFTNISIYEGNFIKKEFIVDSSQTNQTFILDNSNIDTTTIRVEVETNGIIENYEEYRNIFEVNARSRLFLIQEIADEKYQVIFGDNLLGKKPSNGSKIIVSYIVNNGIDGNGASNFTFSGKIISNIGNIKSTVTSGISNITTTQSSENGDEIESIDSVKYLAPRVYASQYRAVTANDYSSLIPSLYANIDSVSAYGGEELDPPEYGRVYITIKPKNGDVISEALKDNIKSNLKKYTVAGIKQELLDLKYLYVEYESTVSYDSSFIPDKLNLQTRITSSIQTYAKSSDINSFGGRLKYSKLQSIIDNVDGGITSNITNIKMRRNLVPLYNELANYEICYLNRFHADLEGFNVKSTSFKLDGVNGDIYLTDFPNLDQKTGVIKFFTLSNLDEVIYVNQNAGKIDYVKGEIILFPTNIVSTGLSDRIEIQVIPESNDIISKQNLYIILDTSANSRLSLIEDVVSSGSNRSGNNYMPPSSFISGKTYIR
tara:strand:+ start:1215 stop:3134 length:1920 start_codon:yes stop_codon:yes gene_type:complete